MPPLPWQATLKLNKNDDNQGQLTTGNKDFGKGNSEALLYLLQDVQPEPDPTQAEEEALHPVPLFKKLDHLYKAFASMPETGKSIRAHAPTFKHA